MGVIIPPIDMVRISLFTNCGQQQKRVQKYLVISMQADLSWQQFQCHPLLSNIAKRYPSPHLRFCGVTGYWFLLFKSREGTILHAGAFHNKAITDLLCMFVLPEHGGVSHEWSGWIFVYKSAKNICTMEWWFHQRLSLSLRLISYYHKESFKII